VISFRPRSGVKQRKKKKKKKKEEKEEGNALVKNSLVLLVVYSDSPRGRGGKPKKGGKGE